MTSRKPSARARARRVRLRRGQLELDDEARAAVAEGQAAVVLLGDRLDEREAEPVARQRAAAVEARETLEHPLALAFWDAGARVRDGERVSARRRRDPDLDPAPVRRVLHRVVEQ